MDKIVKYIASGANSKAKDAIHDALLTKMAEAITTRKKIVASTLIQVKEDVETTEQSLEEAVDPAVKKIKAFFMKIAKSKNVEKFIDELEDMQSPSSNSAMRKLYDQISDTPSGSVKSGLIFDLDTLLGKFEFNEAASCDEDEDDLEEGPKKAHFVNGVVVRKRDCGKNKKWDKASGKCVQKSKTKADGTRKLSKGELKQSHKKGARTAKGSLKKSILKRAKTNKLRKQRGFNK